MVSPEAGYLFANALNTQLHDLEKAGWAPAAGLFTAGDLLRRPEKLNTNRDTDRGKRLAVGSVASLFHRPTPAGGCAAP